MAGPVEFDPRAILAALEAHNVDYVLIGGLAQVLRGVDVITDGVDICPSFARGNLDRLARAVDEIGMAGSRRRIPDVTEATLADQPLVRVGTAVGQLGVVGSPAGIPNGYVELRRTASREDLGGGLRPLVASGGDLAAMAAALHRDQDARRLPMLRRVVELQSDPVRVGGAGRTSPARRAGRRAGR